MTEKGMLLSLGVGETVHHGITEAVREANPTVVAVLATGESLQRTYPKLEVVLADRKVRVFEVSDPSDILVCYRRACEAIEWLLSEGCPREDLTAEFTSGTKAMSAATVLAALSKSAGRLSYVSGKRLPQGTVETGEERPVPLRTQDFLMERELEVMLRQADALAFDTVARRCEQLLQQGLRSTWKRRLQALLLICRSFAAWDRFAWKEAKETLEELRRQPCCKCLQRRLSAWVEHAGSLAAADPDSHRRLVAELLENAYRRAEMGRYDDAIARLYRLLELLAELKFRKEGLAERRDGRTSVLSEKVLPRLSPEVKEKYREDIEADTLGLVAKWEVLADLFPEPCRGVSARFGEGGDLRSVLNDRNSSILAHGLRPLREKDWLKAKEKVEGLVEELQDELAPGLDALRAEVRIPRPSDLWPRLHFA